MRSSIFLFFVFIGAIVHAQEDKQTIIASEIFWDEEFKTTLLFAKEDSNGDIFTVRNYYSSVSNPQGYYIEHYDKDLKLLDKTSIEVTRNELKGLFITDNSVILLQFQYNYKEKEYAFATLTSNKNKFNFTEKKIFTIDRKRLDKYDHFGIRSEPEFNLYHHNNLGDIVTSQNGEFIAINIFTKTKEGNVLLTHVFNKNFERIYEYEFENIITLTEASNKELSLDYQNMVLDNHGKVFFLGKIYGDHLKKEGVKNSPKYYFILFSADAVSKKQEIISIESNNFIHSLQLVTKDNQLAAVGFYFDPNTGGYSFNSGVDYNGVVRFNIKPETLETISESFQPFSEEFMIEKYGKVKGKMKTYLSYRSIFMLDNADVVINAEEFEMYLSDDGINAKRIYKDIIGCRISGKGSLMWAKNINKKQKTWELDDMPFLSYTATVHNNISYYFVNAASELKLLKNNEIELTEGSRLYLLKISETGNFTYNKLLYNDIYNAHLGLRFGVLINNSDFLVQAESNNKPLLVKIAF